MLAADVTSAGSAEEKLKWTFKLYDKDGSGAIDLQEMVDALETLYDIEGVYKFKNTPFEYIYEIKQCKLSYKICNLQQIHVK